MTKTHTLSTVSLQHTHALHTHARSFTSNTQLSGGTRSPKAPSINTGGKEERWRRGGGLEEDRRRRSRGGGVEEERRRRREQPLTDRKSVV